LLEKRTRKEKSKGIKCKKSTTLRTWDYAANTEKKEIE
jgi:hypothetical protein